MAAADAPEQRMLERGPGRTSTKPETCRASRIGWAERSEQLVCDQGDHRAIDAFVQQVADTHGRIDILVNNAGGTVPAPHAEDIPELVQKIQGAPRSDDDYERTVLFHAFAVQMNLISPLWFAVRVFRQMRRQDGTGCIINISSGASHPAGSPTLWRHCSRLVRSGDARSCARRPSGGGATAESSPTTCWRVVGQCFT